MAVKRNQNKDAVRISPGIPNAIREMDKKPAPPPPSSFFSDEIVEASQLASRVTNEVTYVNTQHKRSPNTEGMNPASTVS
eukprot:CAMPEP_0201894346 /NCGR_PEP_ID=MMETSP0902-20130614/40542_1 /ASSEMBLY_ACC=CAM_ASM_000551 /TAXON_ID=420261 /ORGANISM="Thalassiosira antarctica, Strain CCMP982" /LENGTH=79 /DNA_ID=CAMNT_0048426375 /DNA_START=39 /DNA_END=275 /DNA_ORIENTATION=-